MNIEVYGISDVGMRRERNEDSYLVNKDLALFIVADGMGGHVGGEYASRLAVQTIEEIVGRIADDSRTGVLEENGIDSRDYPSHLRYAIQSASTKIFSEAKNDPSLKGMGTTSVVFLARGGRVYIANVGDSRGYLVREGEIAQLTVDHSLVGEQLRAGVISELAARGHRLKNIITRSVGFQDEVDIDVLVKVPRCGDRFLLCSDGLTNMVGDNEILEVVKENSIEEACHILVDMANARGGDDNITVILTEVTGVDDVNVDGTDDESTIGI